MSVLDPLVLHLSRLPGLGPRSARRLALHLISRRETALAPLVALLTDTAARVQNCQICGNLDARQPCGLCSDPTRADGTLTVVESVADVWALERARAVHGRYHVLGGTLSALAGRGPDALSIPALLARLQEPGWVEVILALNPTLEGQTTAHYLAELLDGRGLRITRPAMGVPIGGEMDYLDDGTLAAALAARQIMDH